MYTLYVSHNFAIYQLGQKKMFWFWSSGGSILTQIKKKCGPQNITRHRLLLSVIDDQQSITKTCSFSNFNFQDKILLCLAWFTTISLTREIFSEIFSLISYQGLSSTKPRSDRKFLCLCIPSYKYSWIVVAGIII